MTIEILLLLIAFQIKHFLCDFPLQSQYHLRKGHSEGWVLPLLSHCLVHGAGTFLILMWINPILALILSVLEVGLHFVIDRIKASPEMLGRFAPDNKYFWWSLGLDQMLHHLTYIGIIYLIV